MNYENILESILYLQIGYKDTTISSINYYKRNSYDNLAIKMGINPKNFKNKHSIFIELCDKLPNYLNQNTALKYMIVNMVEHSPNHYLHSIF